MEINGYQTPDESSDSQDSVSSLGTTSDSTFNSFRQKYPLCRELCQSLLHNNMNNCQRLFEPSPESTQHNDDCSKKLDSIIESQAKLENYWKDRRGSIPSESNEQNETLVTMNNYWDKKWHQASSAYTNVHSTVMHIKDMIDTIESKLNANIMKFEGFIQDSVPKLKQILDERAAKNIVIEEISHKCYDAILNLNEVFCRETSCNDVKTEEHARSLNDISNSIKNVEKQLMDVKNQLDNMGKAPVTQSVQQHYPPNGSYPTSPYIPCSSKAAITPLSNSFHHVYDSSHTKVDEKYLGDIHFISKRISNRENRFQRKQFPDKLLKQNTPPFCVKLEPVDRNCNDSNGVSTCHSSGSKGVSFNNNLSGSESKMDESGMFHKKANKIPQTTACSDSKTEPDQTVKKNATSNFNLPSDSKGVSSSATNTRTKSKTNNSKEYKKRPKGICYKKNSPKMVAPHSVVSTSKERLEDQDEDLRGKEQNSKKNAPTSTTASDVYNSDDDDDCMIVAEVVKYPRFNYQQNIPTVQENDANTQVKPSVSDSKKTITKDNNKSDFQAFAAVSSASSSKKPSVLQSGDKKHGSKINILTTKAANHDHMVFTSNEQNVFMSEENAGNMQEKLKELSPRVQSINDGQPNISYGKAISPAITSSSGAQRPATQQSQHRKGKKRGSKESSLNAPPGNAISAEVRNPQLHFRPNIRMSSENAAYNSPNVPPTSDGAGSYFFRTKDSSKRIKTESEENFK